MISLQQMKDNARKNDEFMLICELEFIEKCLKNKEEEIFFYVSNNVPRVVVYNDNDGEKFTAYALKNYMTCIVDKFFKDIWEKNSEIYQAYNLIQGYVLDLHNYVLVDIINE